MSVTISGVIRKRLVADSLNAHAKKLRDDAETLESIAKELLAEERQWRGCEAYDCDQEREPGFAYCAGHLEERSRRAP